MNKTEYLQRRRENQFDKKYEFIQNLKKSPIFEVAAKRVGVHRSTIYRWIKDDKDFSEAVSAALMEGTSIINEMMESILIQMGKERNLRAVTFWLKHRHHAFQNVNYLERTVKIINKYEREDLELSDEEKKAKRELFEKWGLFKDDKKLSEDGERFVKKR